MTSNNVEKIGERLTEGRLFDAVIEASGNLGAARQSLTLAGKCGTIVLASVYPKDAEIAINPFHMFANELKMNFTFISPYSFPRSMSLLPKLDLAPLISEIIPLNEIAKAFELHKKGNSVKILIKP